MSTTVDSRVVEMRFDNQNFERNVGHTMTTLEKLKRSLNLTGASKGLENVNAAAKNVNMNGLGSAVETVSAKFSALQVVGVTALANITNSAVNTGKRMLSALTIDPVRSGFQEYETQIKSVQTILANTSHNGTTIDQVNKALDELNVYADKTIYNFTEMTRNIGTFTAAGVDLDTSVQSIKGIANLAAVSGSTSQQASTAMYQLSQALAAGKVSLMDWNSVVNAGMGGKVFQDALVRTSELLGTGAKGAIDMYGSFRESLTKGEWLTTEVLTETLKQFAGAYDEADLIAQGFTKEQASDIMAMTKTADEAATQVKTFTQLWDVMKESAQSGWSQTWKLLIGDFEEAKNLLTPISEFFTGEKGIITMMSEARNKVLESALGKSFSEIGDQIKSITKPLESTSESISNIVDTVKDYETVVSEIIGGDWGTGQERWDKLAEAGYDWAHAQNLVNEKLGSGVRHATKYQEAQNGVAKTQKDTTEANAEYIASLVKLDDKKLKDLGLSNDQIKALRALEKQSEKTGIPVVELVKDIDLLNGRTLLINGFKNAGNGLLGVFKALKTAWQDIFPPKSTEEKAQKLYDLIAAFHKFTTKLVLTDKETGELNETGKKIVRTFKGLFAIVDVISTVVGGGFKIAFKAVSAVLSYFDMDVLDLTASIGDILVKFRDWVDSILDFDKAVGIIIPAVQSGIKVVKGWIKAFSELPLVQKAVRLVKDAFNDLKEMDLKEIGKNIIDGLINGLGDGASKAINAIIDLGKNILSGICKVLGIHSPSREFFDVGKNIIDGLINGVKNGVSAVINVIKDLAGKIIEIAGKIDWNAVFAAGVSVAMLLTVKKLVDTFSAMVSPLEGLGDLFASASKAMNSFAFSIKADGIKKLATAILMLGGLVIALTFFKPTDLLISVGIIILLAGVLGGLAVAMDKMTSVSASYKDGAIKLEGMKTAFISIGASLLLMALAVKTIGGMDFNQAVGGFIGLGVLIAAIMGVIWMYGELDSDEASKNISQVGGMMIKLSLSMLLMIAVMKLSGKLSVHEIANGVEFMLVFGLFLWAVVSILNTREKDIDKIGGMMIKLSLSMLLMIAVMKLAAKLSPREILYGIGFMTIFGVFVWALVKIFNGIEKDIHKIGSVLMGISGSMLLLVLVAKLIATMSPEEMLKGGAGILALTGIIYLLVKTIKPLKRDAPKIAGTLMALSVSIGILAGVAILLSLISVDGLIKGIAAVGFLSLFMGGMIWAMRGVKDCKGNLIVLVIAIGIMAIAVAALSTIKWEKLAVATAALSALMFMFSYMMKSAKMAKKAMGPLIVLTAVVAVLSGIVYLLSGLPVTSVLGSAVALSMLLLALSESVKILNKAKKVSNSALIAAGVLALVVAALGGTLLMLSGIPVASALASAVALSMLLTVLTSAVARLDFVGKVSASALIATGVLTVIVGALAFILYQLSGLPVASALVSTLALSVLLTAITASVAVLDHVHKVSASALIAAGVMTLIVGALAYILYQLSGLPVESAIPITTALSTLLLALSASCVILSVAGLFGAAAITGAASLAGVIVVVGGLMLAIGALVTYFPGLKDFLNEGIALLEQIAYGIGSFLGNLVGGFLTGATSGLPEVATSLSNFMTNLQPFLEGAKSIDSSIADGVLALTEVILLLSAANLVEGIASFLSGGDSFDRLGTSLSNFILNAMPFIVNAAMIDPAMVEGAKMLADTILVLTAADVLEGLTSWFTGGSSLEDFGAQLIPFGEAIAGFSQAVTGKIDPESVTVAAEAGKILAEMASTLPNSGGVVGFFAGENDMDVFAEQIQAFGGAITAFSSVVGAKGAINPDAILVAAEAGKILADMAAGLPNSGGVLGFFAGENDMDKFAAQIEPFGRAITSFSGVVSAEGAIDPGSITTAAEAGITLANMAKELPNSGGVLGFFTGDNDLDKFAEQLDPFGQAIVGFSKAVSGEDFNPGKVRAAAEAGKVIAQMASELPNEGGLLSWATGDNSLSDFAPQLVVFGQAMKKYSEAVAGIDAKAVSSSASSARKIFGVLKYASDIEVGNLSGIKTALNSLSELNIEGFVKAFSGISVKMEPIGGDFVEAIVRGAKNKMSMLRTLGALMLNDLTKALKAKVIMLTTIGKLAMTKLATGIKSQKSKVASAATSTLTSAVSKMRNYYDNFYSAGSYLVDGFVAGIDENDYKAAAQAAAMANAAVEAAEEALGIQSPSRVFYGVGDYAGQGFINALYDYGRESYYAGSNMAESARNGLGRAISTIRDLIDSDEDFQPVISPVLDLSNIESGAVAVNRMLGQRSTFGITTNMTGISSMMNARRQNGNSNDDVVNAINGLRKDLDKISGPSYSINGLTYDDGSNIANAVETITRAARLERRI